MNNIILIIKQVVNILGPSLGLHLVSAFLLVHKSFSPVLLVPHTIDCIRNIMVVAGQGLSIQNRSLDLNCY